MNILKKTTLATAALALCAGVATADVVTDWNNVTLDVVRQTSTNPPRATRLFAMVHAAVFDAVNGVEQSHDSYHVTTPAPYGASAEAAAAAAAYTVLADQFPDLRSELRKSLRKSLRGVFPGPSLWKGRVYGHLVGRRILQLRAHDGSESVVPYVATGAFGYWQPTPPAFAPALLPQWPYLAPFTMTHNEQFRVPAPPAFDSPEFAESYEEVYALGGVDSSARTADQTQIAYFWEDGPGTVTPPGHWQVIAQQLADAAGNDLMENARLFALLSLTQADAAVVSWDNKYFHDHVRPYTAITQEADDDGNPDTAGDPAWFNLIPTPPFPTYTSGHSTFSGSSSRILEHFFGTDEMTFCGPSPDPGHWPEALTGVVRCWDSLSQAAEEAGQSRIYGGIHWQYDNQEGLNSGRDLADYVYSSFLSPLEDEDDEGDDEDDDDGPFRRWGWGHHRH